MPMADGLIVAVGGPGEYWFRGEAAQTFPAGLACVAGRGRALRSVAVHGDLAGGQCDLSLAGQLAEEEPRALMDGYPAAEVGQVERLLPVAAVGRPDQAEERFVIRDRTAPGRRTSAQP